MTSGDIRPLPIWSAWPLKDEEYQLIREAKQRLGLPFLAQFGRAVPGSPTRVLAIGGKPDFACEYAEVPNCYSKGLGPALAWVLGEHDDARAMTMEETLSDMFGGTVREVEDAGTDGPSASGLGSGAAEHSGERGPVDPNTYDDTQYRIAIRPMRENAEGAR